MQDDKRSSTDICTCEFKFLTVHEYEVILFKTGKLIGRYSKRQIATYKACEIHGNISPESSSGAAISTTQYPSSYHKQFLPGPEDVLQGSPTLLMIFFMCRLPMKTMHLHT